MEKNFDKTHSLGATKYFFQGNIFPKQYHALKTISCFKLLQMPKIQRYSANAIMMANVFKYLKHFPKSEQQPFTRVLKLFWSISHNSQESTCAGAFFDMRVDYTFSLFQAYHLVLRLFLFRADHITSHCVALEYLNPNFFLEVVFAGRWVNLTPLPSLIPI